MRRICSISYLLIFCCYLSLNAQDKQILFEGDYENMPFTEFVETIEKQTGVRFYFVETWVKDISISVSGTGISLQETLDKVLLNKGLDFYIDKSGHIFLTDKTPIITRLPDYSSIPEMIEENDIVDIERNLTSAEQKYIHGRRARIVETIYVGDSDESNKPTIAVIQGRMIEKETGEPLVGATIYIEELKEGSATDVDGHFSLVIRPGKYTVDFNCMGMESQQNYLEVFSNGNLIIPMQKSLIPIEEVSIQANRYHNVRGTQMGFERLSYKAFKEIPLVLGEADVLKIILMLPGVQSVGEGSSGYNVRGGSVDQNMIYINKVPVYNSSHLFGFFTSFNSEIVKDFTLYKSNMPANMGGRLSSIFDISSKQGNMSKFTARGGVSPISARLAVEGPIQKDKSSFILSARTSYSDWMLKQMEDPVLRNSEAGFYDISGALTFEAGKKTLVKAFGYYSHDRFKLSDINEYSYSNSGGSVNIRHLFNQRITGDIALVYGQYDFDTRNMNIPSDSYAHNYRIGHTELKADFIWLSLGKHKLSFGGNAIYYNLNRGLVEPIGQYSYRAPLDLGTENGVETGIYIADEITLAPRLTVYAGLRLVNYLSLGPEQVRIYEDGQPNKDDYLIDTLNISPGAISKSYFGIEPRVSVNYLIRENNSLKFSYNRVHQYLFMLSNTIAIAPTDQWKLVDYNIKSPYVDQLSLGYYQDFPEKSLTTSFEVYYKWYSDIVEYRDGANFISTPNIETEVLQGNQKAYGLEAMIKKNTGKLTGWLAYSYSRSLIQISSPIPGESINKGLEYPSNFDRPHNLTIVLNYKLSRRFSISSNLVYMTGRPVTYPLSIYYLNDLQYIHYSLRNDYRLPDYFRIDFSAQMEGNLKKRKRFHSYWMFNIYNLTGRNNAYSVYFESEEGQINGYKLSIFSQPVITLSWNFKFGNYASE